MIPYHRDLPFQVTWVSNCARPEKTKACFSATSPRATDVKAHVVNETGRAVVFFFLSLRSQYLLEHLRVDKMARREQMCVRTFSHWDFLPVSVVLSSCVVFPVKRFPAIQLTWPCPSTVCGTFLSFWFCSARCCTCFWIFCEASSDVKSLETYSCKCHHLRFYETRTCARCDFELERVQAHVLPKPSPEFSQYPTTAMCVALHHNIPNKLFSSASCQVVQSTWLFKGDCKPHTNINLFPRILWHSRVASMEWHVPTNCSTAISESHQAVAQPENCLS